MSNSTNSTQPDITDVLGVNDQLSLQNFGVALGINMAMAAGFFLFFCIFRTRVPRVFNARIMSGGGVLPPPLPKSFLGWIPAVYKITDQEIASYAGIDALVFLHSMKYGMFFFALISTYNFAVILPLNMSGSNGLEGFESIGMGNLKGVIGDDYGDMDKVYAHIIAVYLTSFSLMYVLHRFYRYYGFLRISYLTKRTEHAYSVLVKNVPEIDATDENLSKLFKFIYGDAVLGCYMIKDTNRLEDVTNKRDGILANLEGCMEKYIKDKKHRNPKHSLRCCGHKVDSIFYYEEQLKKYNAKVKGEKMKYLPPSPSRSAIVTFDSLVTATTCSQSLHDLNGRHYKTLMAPAISDINWRSIQMSSMEKNFRFIVIHSILVALIFFWVIPIAFVQSLTTRDTLDQYWPGLAELSDNNPLVAGFLEGTLPTLILRLFMVILPHICYFLAYLQGFDALSWTEFDQIRKLHLFYFVNIFLCSIITGSLWDSLVTIVENPRVFLSRLGTNLPSQSGFFINFVMLITFGGGFFIELSQADIWLLAWIKKTFFARCKRERKEAYGALNFEYGKYYGQLILVYSIGITFSTIAPLIIPFCFAYCCVGYCIMKHQLLYVHKKVYESGGGAYYLFFKRVIIALIICQLAIFGFLLIKGAWAAPSILPLPVFTFCYYRFQRDMRYKASATMPLKLARDLDQDRECMVEEGEKTLHLKTYDHPFTFKEADVSPNRKLQEKLNDLGYSAHSNLEKVLTNATSRADEYESFDTNKNTLMMNDLNMIDASNDGQGLITSDCIDVPSSSDILVESTHSYGHVDFNDDMHTYENAGSQNELL